MFTVALFAPVPTRHPRLGGSVVQIAGSLPGEPWCSRPQCVPRALAAVATAVGASSSAAGRVRLGPLVPWLVDPGRPERSAETAFAVVDRALAVDGVARQRVDALRELADGIRHGDENAGPGFVGRRRRRRLVDRACHLAVTAVAGSRRSDDERDRALADLLVGVLNDYRGGRGLAPVPDPAGGGPISPVSVVVATRLVDLHQPESLHVRYELVPSSCPDWLTSPWRKRLHDGEIVRDPSVRNLD